MLIIGRGPLLEGCPILTHKPDEHLLYVQYIKIKNILQTPYILIHETIQKILNIKYTYISINFAYVKQELLSFTFKLVT